MPEKLYELTEQYINLSLVMETAEDSADFQKALDSLKDSIEDKAENIGKMLLSLDADEFAVKSEISRLQEKRKTIENRREGLKGYLLSQLISAGIDKVKRAIFTISVRDNPASCSILDENAIPEKFRTIIPATWQPNKKAMIDAMKAGEAIPGAALVNDKKYLSLR